MQDVMWLEIRCVQDVMCARCHVCKMSCVQEVMCARGQMCAICHV